MATDRSTFASATTPDPAFDPDALRERFAQERAKRLRADGIAQYRDFSGVLAGQLDDPFSEPAPRDPVEADAEVLVIGGGFGGLLTGARLREAGLDDVWIVDKAGDFGGTWYWNRYPGAQCDVESYVYLPLLEEVGYIPKAKYAPGPEIMAHAQAIGRHYDLYRNALFNTGVSGARWDERGGRWAVATDRGDRINARFLVVANGILSVPKLPGIPGIETFMGHMFHSSRWDYAYTGGGPEGNLTGLRGKRVGIIGTGASAVQCIPHLADWADHLYVFQRTPSSIDVRGNRPTDPEWARSLQPGWQRDRIRNFDVVTGGGTADEDLVNDAWTEIAKLRARRTPPGGGELSAEESERIAELADFTKTEQIRARVDAMVRDPKTAELLKPWYRHFCKRPCFHDEYLDTYNRPDVTLVDTDGKGVERVEERGVVVGGTLYELDCLVLASGFEVGTPFTKLGGYDLEGRAGARLSEKFRAGVRSLHGIASRGFPNCFIVSGSFNNTQSATTFNFTSTLTELSRQVAYIIAETRSRGARAAEVSEAAEAEWCALIDSTRPMALKVAAACTPGYYNGEGMPEAGGNLGWYPGGALNFFSLLESWRAEGTMAGFELR